MIVPLTSLDVLSATALASLLGSAHCMGMCGPFAILSHQKARGSWSSLSIGTAYHFGRLSTYIALGLLIGLVSELFNAKQWIYQVGVLVGCLFVAIGISRIFWMILPKQRSAMFVDRYHTSLLTWGRTLAYVRGKLPKGNPITNAYGWGLTTTLLPCGWLYLFLMAAITASSVLMSVSMMVAFWLGTLPILSVVMWGWTRLGSRWQSLASPLATTCIVLFGVYLIVSRTSVNLCDFTSHKLDPTIADVSNRELFQKVNAATYAELPCCRRVDP
jgi:uncharacterized protein